MSTPQRQFSPEELKNLQILAEKMEEVSISNWYDGRLVVAVLDEEDGIIAWVHAHAQGTNTPTITFEAPEFLMDLLLYEDEEETSAEEPERTSYEHEDRA